MALRNIVMDGEPGLKKTSRPVVNFDARLAQLLDDMAETLLEANGLGLAAPQVGVLRRVFIAIEEESYHQRGTVDEGDDEEPEMVLHEFINPEIVLEEGEQYGYEGCLSFPGEFGAVKRPNRVVVKAQDRFGETFTMEGEELMARCFCHEINHLDGITFDTLSDYFYDPKVPHELDSTLGGGEDEEDLEEEA